MKHTPSEPHATKSLSSVTTKKHVLANCIFIKEHAHLIKVSYDEILYLSSSHVYVNVVTRTKEFMVRASLSDYITRFDADVFMRIHRSYAVNLNHITRITASSVWVGEKELSLSSQNREELLSKIRY